MLAMRPPLHPAARNSRRVRRASGSALAPHVHSPKLPQADLAGGRDAGSRRVRPAVSGAAAQRHDRGAPQPPQGGSGGRAGCGSLRRGVDSGNVLYCWPCAAGCCRLAPPQRPGQLKLSTLLAPPLHPVKTAQARVRQEACAAGAMHLGLDELLVVGKGYEGQAPTTHMLAGERAMPRWWQSSRARRRAQAGQPGRLEAGNRLQPAPAPAPAPPPPPRRGL